MLSFEVVFQKFKFHLPTGTELGNRDTRNSSEPEKKTRVGWWLDRKYKYKFLYITVVKTNRYITMFHFKFVILETYGIIRGQVVVVFFLKK